jgi:hypothetical protein
LLFSVSPVFALNASKQKMLVSFEYPGNALEFFVFSTKGKLLHTFEFPFDSRFTFPSYTLSYPIKYPPESSTAIVDSIHFYNNHYWVFLAKLHRKGKKVVKLENSCLIFDEGGKHAGALEMEPGLKVFSISRDGYLLAKNYESDIEQVFIYRIAKEPK